MKIILLLITHMLISQSIKPILIYSISNQQAEFYKRCSSVILDNGKLAVLDVGNKKVKLFHKSKLILEFGNGGSGPGEMNRPDKLFKINNTLIIREHYKLNLFTDTGKFMHSISLLINGQVGNPLILDNQTIRVLFNGNSKLLFVDYNILGKELNRRINDNYDQSAHQEDDTVLLSTHFRWMQIANSIVHAKNGPYRLEYMNSEFEIKSVFYRNFDAKKRNPTELVNQMVFDKSLTGKALKKAKNYELNLLLKKLGQYENDIQTIVGEHKGMCIVTTRSKQNLNFDVIKDNKLISQFSIVDTQASEVRLFNNLLIVNLKDRLNGPAINVYRL